jgi:endonuclease G
VLVNCGLLFPASLGSRLTPLLKAYFSPSTAATAPSGWRSSSTAAAQRSNVDAASSNTSSPNAVSYAHTIGVGATQVLAAPPRTWGLACMRHAGSAAMLLTSAALLSACNSGQPLPGKSTPRAPADTSAATQPGKTSSTAHQPLEASLSQSAKKAVAASSAKPAEPNAKKAATQPTEKQINANSGFASCPQFFHQGNVPAIAPHALLRPLCYDAFAILHNGSTKTPVYVAERLNRRAIEDADEKRTNKFFADARLPRSERAELSDYKNSGYARGHMAPAGNMPTPQAMAQSFSLANMVPQSMKHNSGPWAQIEQDTRSYAKRARGDVYVITGPVYAKNAPSVGSNHVRVPTYLFKLVYDASTHRAWAHWHSNRDDTKTSAPISYAELVKRTGIQFLPNSAIQ